MDRIPCSPRIYAYLLEWYGQCGIDAHLRAQEEFGFDVHANPGIFDHVTELGVSASYDLPDVDYGREESTEGAYKVVRRIFRTRSGTVTNVTRFPRRTEPPALPQHPTGTRSSPRQLNCVCN